MNSKWFTDLNDTKEVQAREQELMRMERAFELLSSVLEKEFESAPVDYKSASWAYEQADRNGANRKLRQILDLINLRK